MGLGNRRRKREDGSGKQAVLTCSGASWSALAEGNQAIASSEGGFLHLDTGSGRSSWSACL